MPGIQELVRRLNSENEKERAYAAEDIGYECPSEGIKPLVERLQVEPSRFVREVIVNTLKTIEGPELVENIIPLLRSDDAFIRNAGIEILSRQDTAITPLKSLLHDPDKDVRKFALDAIFQLNDPASAPAIAEALDDPNVNVVITAVEYLGYLEANAYISKINEIFGTTDNLLLRCACLETMALIGDEESVDFVARRYPSYQAITGLELYSYLKFVARKGTSIHLPLLISLIEEKGEQMTKEIINAVEGILERREMDYLPSELLDALASCLDMNINDINKYELLVLMGEYKNEAILSVLLKHVNIHCKLVCLGAIEALGIHGNMKALPILEQLKNQATDDDILEAVDKSLEQLSVMDEVN